MLREHIERDIIKSSEMTAQRTGIAEGSEAFIYTVLRSGLYSDEILSIIREYLVNARDEHRKFGINEVPIEVQLPSHFTPEFKVRDFAGGLTESEVFYFFGNYGASDKRDNAEAVGFYGLGNKSALAYTDSFTITSFKDGLKQVFSHYIDQSEVGEMVKIAEMETTEPNGIEISIPVKTYDSQKFVSKAIEIARFFEVKPNFTGINYVPTYDVGVPVISGDGWEYCGYGSPLIIMGEIAYPLDVYKLDGLEAWEKKLLNSRLHLYVGIGDVHITPNREMLKYTEKTIETVRKRLREVKDEMVRVTTEKFNACNNLIEAKVLYSEISGGYADIVRASGDLLWKGEKIEDSYLRFNQTPHVIIEYRENRRGLIRSQGTNLRIYSDTKFYFDDTDGKVVSYKRRAKTLLDAGASNVYILKTSDITALESMLGMKVSEFPSLAAVVPTIPPSVQRAKMGTDKAKRAKHQTRVFQLNLKNLENGFNAASEVWDVVNADLSRPGLYLSIERFHPNGKITSLSQLKNRIIQIQKLGVKLRLPVYGIKKGVQPGNLVKFEDWLVKKVSRRKEYIQKVTLAESFYKFTIFDVSGVDVNALTSDAKKYVERFYEAQSLYRDSIVQVASSLFEFAGIEIVEDDSLEKLSNEFIKNFPLMPLIPRYNYRNAEVVDYLNRV